MNYSHNREANYKETGDELLQLIDKFADQKELSTLYDHFQKAYSLPQKVVKQKLKQNISRSYKYRKGGFIKELNLRFVFSSLVKYWGALLFAFINSVKQKKINKYKLIIDDISSPHELERFEKLLKLVRKENTLCIATNKSVKTAFPDYNILIKSHYKNYNIVQVLNVIRYEILFGFWISLKASIKMQVNLLPTIMLIIKDYLCYKSLFESNIADYIIQERHYSTNAIKNYLFKKMGGIAAATIQKNILQLDHTIYYIDIDCFFSLGKRTVERAFQYGANIGRVIPVGSLFMEYYWFTKSAKIRKINDIVMLGINTMNAYNRLDSYKEFIDDYYGSIEWLARFKKEYPQYQVLIKHHFSASEDTIESKIISGSGIKVLKDENSYEIAFNSRCAVTFGSTMGYELNAHGLRTFFFDPGYRCSILPDKKDNLIGGLRIRSYEEMKSKMLDILEGPQTETELYNPEDLCLNSSHVSMNIFRNLENKNIENSSVPN